VVCFWDRWNI